MMRRFAISAQDKQEIHVAFFEPHNGFDAVALIIGGVGIRAEFYKAFASYLSEKNIATYIFDYRGIGWSKPKTLKGVETNVTQWAECDIEGMLQYIVKQHPDKKKFIVAHSGGGTILGLAPSVNRVDRIVTIASPQCLRKNYDGMDYLKMCLIVFVLYPLITKIKGYFPSKYFKIGENLPKNVALEWAKWGRHPQGIEAYLGNKISRFHELELPMMNISFDDDFFAPEKSVRGLAAIYKSAEIEHIHINRGDFNVPLDHFCFFRKNNFDVMGSLVLSFLAEGKAICNERFRSKLHQYFLENASVS